MIQPFNPRGALRSREEVVEIILRRFKMEGMDRKVLHHRLVHHSLWTVEMITISKDTKILVMEYETGVFNGAWGYIARREGQIRHATCPPCFFEGVPVKDAEWRKACRESAATAA